MNILRHDLYIEPIDAFIDPMHPARLAIVTHGHADHARAGHEEIIATPQTIEIMKLRYGEACAKKFTPLPYKTAMQIGDVTLSLHPAGHILGSGQVLLEYKGHRAVMTGDFKTRPDKTSAPFEAVPCDLFVTEATFGLPVFNHPDSLEEVRKVLRAREANPERAILIGAYALGKAQRVMSLLREAGYTDTLYIHGALKKLCDYYTQEGIDLGSYETVSHKKGDMFKGQIILGPPSACRDQWARRFPDPLVARASGWMSVRQRAKQAGVELPLVISDHADWTELTQTIKDTGAKTVWVTHGREDALVHYCRAQGLKAEPLYLQGRDEDDEAA